MMTRIGIIRHATPPVKTEIDEESQLKGQAAYTLSEEGLLQAYQIATRLSREPWDVIYSSDVMRAMQTTAVIIGEIGDIAIRIDKSLREPSVAPFFRKVMVEHKGQRVLLVSHAKKIRLMLKEAMPDGKFDIGIPHTSLSILEQTEDGWRCPLLNCTRHLKEEVAAGLPSCCREQPGGKD